MATSVYPGEDPQLRIANEKIADLLEDVRRLSAELRDKDALLARTMEVTHEQSMRIASLSAAFQDTAPWDPSCPRPSSCSTPNRQRSWTEVVIRGRQKTPVKAVSPPLSLSNRFMALSPTTLIIGDSIVRNIRFFNATTRCFPGATVAVILDKLPELLQSIQSSVCRVIIHIGTNDTTRRQSELMKQDFMDLFRLMESCGKSVFISGPIPTLSHGAERFSRLLSLSTWLQHTCTAHKLNFIDNFNLFWNRPGFYRQDGLHPSTLGSSVLTANIHHTVQSTPAD
uniref:SGNH hydrolase-type esterase domain-containing protein n=1 Tax=Amphiprion ocellaris TaxID=80972 RepID=A0AAQ5ZE09_AMPOC